jgi:hypothetical protein
MTEPTIYLDYNATTPGGGELGERAHTGQGAQELGDPAACRFRSAASGQPRK